MQACFIDEELRWVDSLGLHSLYLVSEIKQKASYPQMFVNVLHGLSKKYCEAWASILLEQKIKPLRELMQIEQYDLTNEVRFHIVQLGSANMLPALLHYV